MPSFPFYPPKTLFPLIFVPEKEIPILLFSTFVEFFYFWGKFFRDVDLLSIPALHGPLLASHPAPPQGCGSTHEVFLKSAQMYLSKA